jgi:hypothetical protein
MHRVSDDQGELVWDALVGFSAQGEFIALWIVPDDRLEGLLGQEIFKSPVQIVDVMVGPFNLEQGGHP